MTLSVRWPEQRPSKKRRLRYKQPLMASLWRMTSRDKDAFGNDATLEFMNSERVLYVNNAHPFLGPHSAEDVAVTGRGTSPRDRLH
jgi:hypothetical protein